jgi:hypothetical protein
MSQIESAPAAAPASGPADAPATAWAAFSAWRGDQRLFSQAVHAAQRSVERAEGAAPECEITVTVPGSKPARDGGGEHRRLFDEERFTDPGGFATDLSRQALIRWTEIRGAVTGGRYRVDIRLRRGGEDSDHLPGVTLAVADERPDSGSQARDIRERVAASLSRGGFRRAHEPEWGEEAAGGREPGGARTAAAPRALEAALARRYEHRERLVLGIAVAVGFAAALVVTAIGWALSRLISADASSGPVIVAAAVTGILLLLGVVAMRRSLFPAIDMANVTPGRRMAQLVTRGLGLGTLLSFGIQLLTRLVSTT